MIMSSYRLHCRNYVKRFNYDSSKNKLSQSGSACSQFPKSSSKRPRAIYFTGGKPKLIYINFIFHLLSSQYAGGNFYYWQCGAAMYLNENFNLSSDESLSVIGASAGSITATLLKVKIKC